MIWMSPLITIYHDNLLRPDRDATMNNTAPGAAVIVSSPFHLALSRLIAFPTQRKYSVLILP